MQTAIESIPDQTIAVIGDVMLDLYLSGDVTRISPEAPVPVVLVSGERAAAGGAANVAANLASLGVQVRLVGVSGVDREREALLTVLGQMGNIDCTGIITMRDKRTITKLRVIGAHQQIVRIDREDMGALDAAVEAQVVKAACDAIDAASAVVISDYGKGVCSDTVLRTVIERARAANKLVVVDPKRPDFAAYRGASFLTPNRRELTDATGMPCESDAEATMAAAEAISQTGADLVLTRSEKGISYFPAEGDQIHLPTVAQDVFDVSGAGDTVVAVLVSALAAHMPMSDALRLANHAAGIVVSKLGTSTVTMSEIVASLSPETIVEQDGRLLDRSEAVAQRHSWAQDRLVVGFTNGCFDLLHPGHVSLLREAASACDRLIVGINSDASVRRLKGSERPIQSELARSEVIGAIRGVAAVVIFDEDNPLELIRELGPDLLVKGADYALADVVGADFVTERGGRVLLTPIEQGHSTTNLIASSR
jgi:D-beta-D-heptose 7-phosphate kinase/D-beta-D-heptose 1-phosphate adenosyltransferase